MNRLSDAGGRLRPCGTTIVTERRRTRSKRVQATPRDCTPFWGGAAIRQRGIDPPPTAFQPRRKPVESELA
jgi:hypothetical protein